MVWEKNMKSDFSLDQIYNGRAQPSTSPLGQKNKPDF